VKDDDAYLTVRAGDQQYRVQLPPEDQRESGMSVQVDYRPFTIEWSGSLGATAAPRRAAGGGQQAAPRPTAKGGVTAQIAGRVISIKTKVGDEVKAGDVLLLLEAMKMENEIKSPKDGIVKDVPVAEGQRVSEGDTLVVVE
jgi:biotin carboxyl carrier protein